MAAPPLKWKEGEGLDIHPLRAVPESKTLIDALDVDASQKDSVFFSPNLEGGVDKHGVELEAKNGIVRVLVHPDSSFHKVNNFLLSDLFADPGGTKNETVIRIHIHDSVKYIWLTPSTLTIHQGADECRFTVLARFNDDSIGDTINWPGLTYQSADASAVKVLSEGVLQAVESSGSASVTVNLTLTSPDTNKTSAPATALASPNWTDRAKAATVSFEACNIVTNTDDPDNAKPVSVKSVVENAMNILFIADGFRGDQRFDYRNIVNTIVRVMRGVACGHHNQINVSLAPSIFVAGSKKRLDSAFHIRLMQINQESS